VSLHIVIATGSVAPIYRQIVDQVRLAVAAGAVSEGDPLPSVRALAEELVVNPNTVAKAYADLIRDGVIESQAGRGTFIGPRRQVFTKAERQRRVQQSLDTFVNQALSLDFTPQEIRALVAEHLDRAGARTSSGGRNHE
jgi:GntR family transcriptional regulator